MLAARREGNQGGSTVPPGWARMEEEEDENIAQEEEEEEHEQQQQSTAPEQTTANHHSENEGSSIETLGDSAEVGRFVGHSTPVQSFNIAREAGILVTGGDDETVRLFDLNTKAYLTNVGPGFWLTSPIRAVAISPDASVLVVAARENVAKVLRLDRNVAAGPVLSLPHDHWVRAVCANWRTNRLATAANDGSLRLWNLENGAEVRTVTRVGCGVAVTMNDRMVVAGFHDPVARGFFIADEEAPILEFFGHAEWVTSVSMGERRLMTGSNDKTCRVFDLETQECLAVLRGHLHSVTCVAISPCETRGLSGSNDGSLIFWSFYSGGEPLLRIKGDFGSVRACMFFRAAHEVCCAGWDGSIRVYNLHHKDNLRILALCYATIDRLASPDCAVRKIVHRDVLSRVRNFLLKTNTMLENVHKRA